MELPWKEWLKRLRQSPTWLMGFFCVANLLNYMDRGIIPGATIEFESFIQESKELHGTSQADAAFAALQSSYIVGYSLASVVVGNLIHKCSKFRLVGYGLLSWCAAAVVAGASRDANSFVILLVARMMSGVGEASFQVVAAPFIQDNGGERQGAWLGLYYTAVPLGTAIGYIYGAAFANSPMTWAGAFFTEAFLMLPMALYCFSVVERRSAEKTETEQQSPLAMSLLSDERDDDLVAAASASATEGAAAETESLGLKEEAMTLLRNELFLFVALGYAGYAATIMGFATFGPAFVMGLGFFDDEKEASLTFGAIVSIAGIVGTPVGGLLLDRGKAWSADMERKFYQPVGRVKSVGVPLSVRSVSLIQVLVWIVLGSLLSVSVIESTERAFFMLMIGLGITLLMAPTAGMNLCLLESVPAENRSLAVGLGVFIMHALGDVPSPIIVGAIKGQLAPDCTPRGGDAHIPDECEDQQDGLRTTLYILNCWILWAVLGFSIALHLSRKEDTRVCVLKQLDDAVDLERSERNSDTTSLSDAGEGSLFNY